MAFDSSALQEIASVRTSLPVLPHRGIQFSCPGNSRTCQPSGLSGGKPVLQHAPSLAIGHLGPEDYEYGPQFFMETWQRRKESGMSNRILPGQVVPMVSEARIFLGESSDQES